jgi:hypothetical protein
MENNLSYVAFKKRRKTWEINPKTRCKGNDKEYDRNKEKRRIKNLLKTEDF